MAGPMAASRSPGWAPTSRASASTARAAAWASVPRHPAWTAATAPERGSPISTGTQSATDTHAATPGRAEMTASASSVGGPASCATTTRSPWTWWTRANASPVMRWRACQFASTRAALSPTAPPRLKLANGSWDAPPCRVVKPCGKPARRALESRSMSLLSCRPRRRVATAPACGRPSRGLGSGDAAMPHPIRSRLSRKLLLAIGLPPRALGRGGGLYLGDETNRRLEGRLRELTVLSDLARTLNSTLALDELLPFVTELVGRTLGFEAFALLLVDEPSGELVVRSMFGMSGVVGERIAPGAGLAGWAGKERQLLLVRDTREDARFPVERWTRGHHGSALAVPMIVQGECVGVLDFFRPVVDAFGDDEVRFLQSVASQAAMAIANARLHERAVALSLTDALTGLHNRRSLFARLELKLERSERFSHACAVAMVDVDHFKEINNAHGHLAGDATLRRVGELLGGAVRKIDTVARYGGEEFALVLPRADRAAALEVAEKVSQLVAATPLEHDAGQPGGKITISVGVATFPDDARDLATLVDSADAALFAAKRAGRNTAVAFAPGMRENPGRRRDVRHTAQVEPGGV